MNFNVALDELKDSIDFVPGGNRTVEAFNKGTLTAEDIKNGAYIDSKGKKVVDQTKWGSYAEDRRKKQAAAAKKEAEVKKAVKQKAVEDKKTMEEKAKESIEKQQKLYDIISSKDDKDINPTVKLSPWFWDNINSLTQNTKDEVNKIDEKINSGNLSPEEKENALTVKSRLSKKLGGERAKLYADHILNSLSNVALSTANWTGAEAGHSPNFELKDSIVDNYKKENIKNYNRQLQKITTSDVERKIGLRDTLDDQLKNSAGIASKAIFTSLENDAKYKGLEDEVKYRKMISDMPINQQDVITSSIKIALLGARTSSDVVDALKTIGINVGLGAISALLKGTSPVDYISKVLDTFGLK